MIPSYRLYSIQLQHPASPCRTAVCILLISLCHNLHLRLTQPLKTHAAGQRHRPEKQWVTQKNPVFVTGVAPLQSPPTVTTILSTSVAFSLTELASVVSIVVHPVILTSGWLGYQSLPFLLRPDTVCATENAACQRLP